MPSQADIECFRNLPRHIVSLCAGLIGSAKEDVENGYRSPDSLRLLINGDEWLDFLLKDPVFDNCKSYYILLDEQIRRWVDHLRSNGFTLAVFFVNTGLDWVHKHFKCGDYVLERDYRDTPLGQALCTKILPILGVNQMYHTLLDLGVAVHGGRFRRNRELVESLQYNVMNSILLTSVKDDIWLRSGVSVVHFEDAMPPNGLCRIWNSVLLQNILNLNRTQFIEMLCVFSVLDNTSFHKGCLNIPSQGAMQFLNEISLHNVGSFADWLSYQDYGFRFSSPIFEINEALVSCRVYYSVKPGPNVAELMDRLLIPEKGEFRGGRDDPFARNEGGRDPSGKWHFPVPGYGYVLPMYLDLFPKLEHKLKEHAIRSKGNGRAIPVIALRYLRRNTDDCPVCIEQENMSSLEDGLRISHRSYPKIRQDIIDCTWGNPDEAEPPLIPMCAPEMPSQDCPITTEDILAFNRFQIVCEALWLQCPHAFITSPANTPAFYANDGLYRSQLLRIRRVDRFNKSVECVPITRLLEGGENEAVLSDEQLQRLPINFHSVDWASTRYSELDDESNAEENMSVSTISPRGSPRGIERSSFRAGAGAGAGEADWVSISQEGGERLLHRINKNSGSNTGSSHDEGSRSSSPRASSDFKTFEAISSLQSQGIAFDSSANELPRSPDSKFFPTNSPGKSLEFPLTSTGSVGSGFLSPGSSQANHSPQKGDNSFVPYSNLLDGDMTMSLFGSGPGGDILGGNSSLFGQPPISRSSDKVNESRFLSSSSYEKGRPSMYDHLSSDAPTLLDTLSVLNASVSAAKPTNGRAPAAAPPGFSDPSSESPFFGGDGGAKNGALKSAVDVPVLQFSSLPKNVVSSLNARVADDVPVSSDASVQQSFSRNKNAILAHIGKHRVSVIQGLPGCGKSIGIPSMLFEAAAASGQKAAVIVSEHDTFAALSMKIILEKAFGDAVGILSAQDAAVEDTKKMTSKIFLSTTVFLTRFLAKNPAVLNQYTHIIIDDVNERTIENDLLCMLMKSFLPTLPHLKVVLVSATPDVDLFRDYFGLPGDCVLSVGQRTNSVKTFYTDDLFGFLDPKYDKLINKIHTGYCNRAQEMQAGTPRHIRDASMAQSHFDRPIGSSGGSTVTPGGMKISSLTAATATFHFAESKDKLHIPNTISSLSPRSNSSNSSSVTISDATIRDQLELALALTLAVGKPGQTIVIFVAGLIDMYELSEKFEIKRETNPETAIFEVHRFHAEMTESEHIAALSETPTQNRVKVVIIGDLSESSVNVTNVNHVICLGASKMLTMNETYRAFQQVNYFISQAVANQRAGKTGRTGPGNVYRLYAKDFFSCLPGHSSGDIVRLPIPKVLMQVSFLLAGCAEPLASKRIQDLLSELPESPLMQSVETGLDILTRGKVMNNDSKLTKFGMFACELGKDLSVCSLLFDGITLGIGSVAVVIAAALMLRRSPFKCASSAIYTEPDDYYEIVRSTVCSKAKLDGGFLSEPLMLLSLLIRWRRCRNDSDRNLVCVEYELSFSRMDDFDKSVIQLTNLVAAIIGVKMDLPADISPYITSRVANMVRLISVWSFAENICKMDAVVNPPSSHLNCAVIQAQRDITHSLFERLLLGPRDSIIEAPKIKWKLVERGKKTYTAIAVERPFKDTLLSFKSVFSSVNAQVGWIECKHLDPEEVVIIAREELHHVVSDVLNSLFPAVDIIGIHDGIALYVLVGPSPTNMRRMVEVYFDAYASISFVTSATSSKQRRTYYHATFTCCNCQPTVAHIRHVFLRSTAFCRPCTSAYARECNPASPCDLHWKVSAPELVERFSNWFFKTKVINASTLLAFMDDPPSAFAGSAPPRAFTINDIPIGLRILNSIRSGSQKNQVLHLSDGSPPASGSGPNALSKVDVKMKTAEPQWVSFRHDLIQTACGVGILANSSGTPKRVVMPLQSLQQVALHTGQEELYCVCGSLSILADNTARAAGVSFLPLGQKWLNIALFSLEPENLKQYTLKYGLTAAEFSKAMILRSYISQGPHFENVPAIQAIVEDLFQEWC